MTTTNYKNLFVSGLDGKTKTFTDVPYSTTVGELQGLIQEHTGVPSTEQRLIYAGKELQQGSRTLVDYGIPDEGTIHLVLRLLGGSSSSSSSIANFTRSKKRKDEQTRKSQNRLLRKAFKSKKKKSTHNDHEDEERNVSETVPEPVTEEEEKEVGEETVPQLVDLEDPSPDVTDKDPINVRMKSVLLFLLLLLCVLNILFGTKGEEIEGDGEPVPAFVAPVEEDGKAPDVGEAPQEPGTDVIDVMKSVLIILSSRGDTEPIPVFVAPVVEDVKAPEVAKTTKFLTTEIAKDAGVTIAAHNESCMIKLEANVTEPRAKMPCGHAITPEGLAGLANSLVDEKRLWRICCVAVDDVDPKKTCAREWDWTMVRKVAMFSEAGEQEEKKKIETKLSVNRAIEDWNGKICPNSECKATIVPEGVTTHLHKVQCSLCKVSGRIDKSYFCWRCNQSWIAPTTATGTATLWCGNISCLDGKKSAFLALANSSMVQLRGSFEGSFAFPAIRACPHCVKNGKIRLIIHNGGCKHISPHSGPGGCQKSFCCCCLGVPNETGKWLCGGAYTPCSSAPIQSEYQLASCTL